jgi:hypothetical protein
MTEEQIERTIVVAEPWWFVATYVNKENSEGVIHPHCVVYEPIIAWVIERRVFKFRKGITREGRDWGTQHTATPVTLHGSPEESRNLWGVKSPTGEITVPYSETFDTEEGFLAAMAERAT